MTSPFSHLPPAITASASRMLFRYASSLETSAVSMVMPSGFSPSDSCGYDVSVTLPNGVATTLKAMCDPFINGDIVDGMPGRAWPGRPT